MSKPKFKVGDRVVITEANVFHMKIGADAVGKITNVVNHHQVDFSETDFDYIVIVSSTERRLYVNVREATAMDEVLCDEL
jgi:hypothetical protein